MGTSNIAALFSFAIKGTPLWRMSITFALCAFMLWSWGMGPSMLGHGFALADDAEKEHNALRSEMTAEVAGVKSEVSEVKKAVADLTKTMADNEAQRREELRLASVRTLRKQIYETDRDACNATAALRAQLQAQAQDLRAEYMRITSTEYPVFNCAAFR